MLPGLKEYLVDSLTKMSAVWLVEFSAAIVTNSIEGAVSSFPNMDS